MIDERELMVICGRFRRNGTWRIVEKPHLHASTAASPKSNIHTQHNSTCLIHFNEIEVKWTCQLHRLQPGLLQERDSSEHRRSTHPLFPSRPHPRGRCSLCWYRFDISLSCLSFENIVFLAGVDVDVLFVQACCHVREERNEEILRRYIPSMEAVKAWVASAPQKSRQYFILAVGKIANERDGSDEWHRGVFLTLLLRRILSFGNLATMTPPSLYLCYGVNPTIFSVSGSHVRASDGSRKVTSFPRLVAWDL